MDHQITPQQSDKIDNNDIENGTPQNNTHTNTNPNTKICHQNPNTNPTKLCHQNPNTNTNPTKICHQNPNPNTNPTKICHQNPNPNTNPTKLCQQYYHGRKGVYGRGRVRGLPRLLAINSLVCGVEIVSSAAFTYIPPLLLKAGYTETVMTIILGIAPFMALVSVPVLAEWSDRCSSPLGRRRPFIMLLSSLLLLSLVIVPYGSTIIALIAPDSSPKVNMVVLAVGVILLDYSYQALFNPCESLLSDLMATAPEWEQTRGFTVYSAGISLGCILGYLIVSIDWSSIGLLIGTQEQTAFSVIFVLFLPCLFLTLVLAQEKPFRGKGSTSDQDPPTKPAEVNLSVLDLTTDKATLTRDYPSDGGYESGSSESDESSPLVAGSGDGMRWRRYPHLIHQTLHKLSRLPRVTLHRLANSSCKLILRVSLLILYFPYQLAMLPVDTWRRVSTAPVVLRRLFFSELFGWMGIMCHNMFFTDFVGQYMYGGHPDAPERTQQAALYDEGVRMGSWGLFLHSMTACLYAFCLQQHMVRLAGHRAVFVGGLAIFTAAMSATIVSPSIVFLNVVTALSGIGFAALTSTPNMLVTMYNSDRQLYMWDDNTVTESCEERGLGTDVAVLDMAYFLSQIVLSVCMGPLVDLTGSALPYMVVAALTGAVSVYCGSRVIFTDKHLMQLRVGAF